MALIAGCWPSTSIFFSSSNSERVPRDYNFHGVFVRASSSGSSLMTEPTISTTNTKRSNFGFKNLRETFWVDVQRAEGRPLDVELNAPLSIGSVNIEKVENVAIRVELSNGCVGWGEVAVVPNSVTAPNQSVALSKVREACEFLRCTSPLLLDLALNQIAAIFPGTQFASVRAGVEMALIDAVANSIDVPLWRLFGGVSNTLSTSITLPTASPTVASELASKYCQLGFKTFKLQLGKNINNQIKVLQSIQSTYPQFSFILDASEGYTPKEAIQVLHKLHDSGIRLSVVEQPVQRDDWKGLGEVSKLARAKYGMRVAVDESCESLSDVERVIQGNFADVINIKLAKFGVMGALEVVELARKSGMSLMISSTVETRLATGFAAHLAAGLGCFKFVGLDMPFLLSEDPVICGYEVYGEAYKLLNARGQGGFLKWEFTS